MSTALLTGNELKRIILEETDKVHIEKETDLFFEALFDFHTNVSNTIQKLEEIAIKSYDRKIGLISEAPGVPSPKLRRMQAMAKAGLQPGAQGTGNFMNLSRGSADGLRSRPDMQMIKRRGQAGIPRSTRMADLRTKFAQKYKAGTRFRRQGLMNARLAKNAQKATKQTGMIRRLLQRLSTLLKKPIEIIAKTFKNVLGPIASRASGTRIGALAQRVAKGVTSRLGVVGAAGAGPIILKIAGLALTAYTIYQIGNAAWNYILPQAALATTDPTKLALMRANTIAHAAKNGRFLAGDWANWPKEVQCAFCKQNPKRQKPEVKPGVPVSTGPTCADLAANKICDKVKPPKPPRPGRRGCCATNTKLIKKNPDLGPNVKAGFKELKDLLKAAGFGKDLDSSGKCDRKLCNAIKAFQKANGLTADSLYGPKSHAKMQEVLGKKIKGGKVSIVATGIKLNKKTNTYEATATTSDGKSFKGSQPRSGSDDTGDMNAAKAEARDKAKAYIAKK